MVRIVSGDQVERHGSPASGSGCRAEPHGHPHHAAHHRGRQRPRLVVDDEEAARRRQLGDLATVLGHGIRRSGRARRPPRPRSSAACGSKPAGSSAGASGSCSRSTATGTTAPAVGARSPSRRCLSRCEAGWSTSKTVARASSGIRQARASRPAPSTTTCAGTVVAHGVVDGDGARHHEHSRCAGPARRPSGRAPPCGGCRARACSTTARSAGSSRRRRPGRRTGRGA